MAITEQALNEIANKFDAIAELTPTRCAPNGRQAFYDVMIIGNSGDSTFKAQGRPNTAFIDEARTVQAFADIGVRLREFSAAYRQVTGKQLVLRDEGTDSNVVKAGRKGAALAARA